MNGVIIINVHSSTLFSGIMLLLVQKIRLQHSISLLLGIDLSWSSLSLISSKSLSVCNRFHARWANSGKITIFRWGTPLGKNWLVKQSPVPVSIKMTFFQSCEPWPTHDCCSLILFISWLHSYCLSLALCLQWYYNRLKTLRVHSSVTQCGLHDWCRRPWN